MTLDLDQAGLDPVQYAVPVFVISIVAEILLARFRKAWAAYEFRDTATSSRWARAARSRAC